MLKGFVVFLIIFISTIKVYAFDLNWYDLELNNFYQLKTDIKLTEEIIFRKGESLEFVDSFSGGIPAVYFQLHILNCQNPDLKTEMVLINPSPEDLEYDRSVAVTLEGGCFLGIWVESRDLFTSSLFLNLGTH